MTDKQKTAYEWAKSHPDYRSIAAGHARELAGLVDELEKQETAWISVKDRLPEKQIDVLVLFDHNMAVGFWCDTDEDTTFWCAYTDDGFYTDCDVEPTHWMPLPELPKEN